MTLKQLMSPIVLDWIKRKETNSLNENETQDFDQWLIENEDLINKSVEDNIESINEDINLSIQEFKSLNEGLFGDDFDDADEDDDVFKTVDVETDDDVVAPKKTIKHSIIDAKKLNNAIDDIERNVFVAINSIYKSLEKKHQNLLENKMLWSKLDVSNVTDMSALFAFTNLPEADLSSWNTSNVKHMEGMFYKSTFDNESICGWNVSNCTDFKNMFAYSRFNQSLKMWKPGYVEKVLRASDGSIVREETSPGSGIFRPVTKNVRADLPKIGAAAIDEMEALQEYWDDWLTTFEDDKDEDMKNENKNMKYIVDYDTFVNEGLTDTIKQGIDKVKSILKSFTAKIGDYLVASFYKSGKLIEAISPYTSLNYISNGQVEGVKVACKVKNEFINENVSDDIDIVESPEFYGIVDKDSIEYKNYQTFKSMLNEHYEKFGNLGGLSVINEVNRVGFKSALGGLRGVPDINSSQLEEILNDAIKNVPAYMDDDVEEGGGSILIWGAPGIGKSSIPKSVVKAWNKNPDNAMAQKALMVVECGDLTPDGFTLPIPVHKTIEQYLSEKPLINNIIKKFGIDPDKMEKFREAMCNVSKEAPKTWLPCFKVTSDQDEVNVMNAIANGHISKKTSKGILTVTETTEGGILLFDEFFRADESIFKILMQLILNRNYNDELQLGNKWAIIACSNRPNDDDEVDKAFSTTGAVLGTRFLGGQYNFIPDFNRWKIWATKEGHFDPITLEFLMKEKDASGEYTNWHTIKPQEYTQGKTGWPTPRTWSGLMHELHLYKKNHGYKEITDIPIDTIRLKAQAIIGEEMADAYCKHLEISKGNILNVNAILTDTKYVIPSELKISEVSKKILDYIKVKYSSEDLPTDEELTNLYNKLDKTYPPTKDNFVKETHIEIIKHLDGVSNEEVQSKIHNYIKSVIKRYNVVRSDFK